MKTRFIGGEESLDRSFHPMADKNSIHLLYQTLFDHSKHLLGYSIFTEGETLVELKENIKDALRCHFDKEEDIPPVIRLHIVKEEVVTL